jgi:CRP/FNR family transcriptional regulator, nitrogen oxide reductase regulator
MAEQVGATFVSRASNGSNSVGLMNQRIALVQRFPLFTGVSPADCATIVGSAHERQFVRRQTIFLEGDPVRQILLLISGSVKVTQFGQSGTEVILRLNGPGEIVGGVGLRARGDHCSTAQALESCGSLTWEAASFEALSDRYPALRRNIVRILEQRLDDMDQRFREISTEKVAPRLSSQLVRLLNQVGKRVNGHVEISLSREELAQLTGTTLFTVSRLLCQWEVLGIVNARREAVQVRNLPALIALSQGE